MAGTEAFRQRSAEDIATEKIIRSIAVSLDSPEAVGVISEESLGGNAGRNNQAVNAYVDGRTGEIKMFGNPQRIPEKIRKDHRYVEVVFTFSNNMNDVRGFGFVDVVPSGPEGELSSEALRNLKDGVRLWQLSVEERELRLRKAS